MATRKRRPQQRPVSTGSHANNGTSLGDLIHGIFGGGHHGSGRPPYSPSQHGGHVSTGASPGGHGGDPIGAAGDLIHAVAGPGAPPSVTHRPGRPGTQQLPSAGGRPSRPRPAGGGSSRPGSGGGSGRPAADGGGGSRPGGGSGGGAASGGAKPGAAKPGAKPKPKPAAATKPVADTYVQDEINRQIAQDLGLTNYVDSQTASIAALMGQQANEAAQVAGQFAPVTAYANPTLDANAQQRIAQDAGLTNQVGADAAGSLAGLIAKQGSAGTDLMGNMRGASQLQHRDYARFVQGLKPSLDEARREEKRQAALQQTQMDIAKQQFLHGVQQDAMDNAFRYDNLNATMDMAAANNASQGQPKPGDSSKYGFGLDKKYDAAIDSLFGTIADQKVPVVGPDGKPTGAMQANPNRRWRDVIAKLTGVGVPGGVAVILASKWLPERLKIHGRNSPSVIYKALKSGELGFKVSDAVAKQVLANIGPNAWAQRNPSRAQSTANTAVDTVGSFF